METAKENVKTEGGVFKCSLCSLKEKYHYKGRAPEFSKTIVFLEDCYVLRDPFSPSSKRQFLVLGSDCCVCNNPVCQECSVFYTKRFCSTCAQKNITSFPLPVQKKINKS